MYVAVKQYHEVDTCKLISEPMLNDGFTIDTHNESFVDAPYDTAYNDGFV